MIRYLRNGAAALGLVYALAGCGSAEKKPEAAPAKTEATADTYAKWSDDFAAHEAAGTLILGSDAIAALGTPTAQIMYNVVTPTAGQLTSAKVRLGQSLDGLTAILDDSSTPQNEGMKPALEAHIHGEYKRIGAVDGSNVTATAALKSLNAAHADLNAKWKTYCEERGTLYGRGVVLLEAKDASVPADGDIYTLASGLKAAYETTPAPAPK